MTFYADEVVKDSPAVLLTLNESWTQNLGFRGITYAAGQTTTWRQAPDGGFAPFFSGPAFASYAKYTGIPYDILNANAWSVEAWFRRDTQTQLQDIVNVFNTAVTSQIAIFQWGPGGADDRKLNFRIRNTSGTAIEMKSASVTDTLWHHVAMTTDGATVRCYLDGVQFATSTHFKQNFASGDPMWVANFSANPNQENWTGNIYGIGIYAQCLTPERVAAHYSTMIYGPPAVAGTFRGWGVPL